MEEKLPEFGGDKRKKERIGSCLGREMAETF